MVSMLTIERFQKDKIKRILSRKKSVLLLGPRQTGKTTLIKSLKYDLYITLLNPAIRQRYEKNPELLYEELDVLKEEKKEAPIIIIDEIQKVPSLLDVIQEIIDDKKAIFILTGSSARKLRRGANINLLPGRVISIRLDSFSLVELDAPKLMNLLLYGSLPGICFLKKEKEEELESYVTNYLEEEIRAESIVRNLGNFARFLELSAAESGNIINLRKLASDIGVTHNTISSYYQILEDCLIIERIESITFSKTRKKLTQSDKYLFFDLGVRRLAAKEGSTLPKETIGKLFEQFIGLELIKLSRIGEKKFTVNFWRDPDGPEVDWVLNINNTYIPIEVKLTDSPSQSDIKHLKVFLSEYKNSKTGYIICQTPRKLKLDENIYAISWLDLKSVII